MSLSLAACLCVFTSCVAYHPSHHLCAISALFLGVPPATAAQCTCVSARQEPRCHCSHLREALPTVQVLPEIKQPVWQCKRQRSE